MTLFGPSEMASELAIEGVISQARATASTCKVKPQSAQAPTASPATAAAALPLPYQGALQTAAKLKVLLGRTGGIVAVSGVEEGDNATPLAASLGPALAALDESPVLIVDANVRNARLHEFFRVRAQPGILELLEQKLETSLTDKMVRFLNGEEEIPNILTMLKPAAIGFEMKNLFFLPLGQASVSLAALLGHPHAKWIFEEIRKIYRYVIIDTGAIRSGADGVLLASMTDGVVAALTTGARKRHELLQFQQELKQLNIRLLGIVLTKTL